MIRSMTAFSRCSIHCELGHLTFEVHSLNRRHLEIQTLMPREFLELDAWIKKQVQGFLSRGQVQVMISFTPHHDFASIQLEPNLSLAKQVQNAWLQVCNQIKLEESQAGLQQLLVRENHLFQTQVDPEFCNQIKPHLEQGLTQVLEKLTQMRLKEGKCLQQELATRIDTMDLLLKEVKKLHKQNVNQIKEKLKERLEKLLDNRLLEDDRLLKEAAFLADKADIAEELLRISSHLNQFKQTLELDQKGHGKMLDFISQELNREWNTIGAKCSDTQISAKVLAAKSECEKIREQIHNIE